MTDTSHSQGHSSGGGENTLLQSIDSATLTPLVRQALDSDAVEVVDWSCQQFRGDAGWGSGLWGVYRFSGEAQDHGQATPWSLILKTAAARPDRDDPSDSHYWKREVLAYQSGLLDDLPGELAAPQCYAVVEHSDGECWIWMEDVKDDIAPRWPLEHYGVVARHLGQFNGAYVMGRPIPSEPWLGTGWLRSRFGPQAAEGIARLRDSLKHPLVRRVYPPEVAEGVFRLWSEREALLDALDRLPQAFCHLDIYRRNLFARHTADGDEETVAIDWAFVGTGAVGEELAPLVLASVFFEGIGWDRMLKLDSIVFDGYLKGLRDAGWQGDARLARFGYVTAAALRYGVSYTGLHVSVLLDESQRARWAQRVGCSVEEYVDQEARGGRSLHMLAEEARELLDAL